MARWLTPYAKEDHRYLQSTFDDHQTLYDERKPMYSGILPLAARLISFLSGVVGVGDVGDADNEPQTTPSNR